MSDPVVTELLALHIKRESMGLAKYGVDLSRGDLGLLEWLKHARDEAMDEALYLTCAIRKLEGRQ